jgi:GDPmannose 4,6-dehydratase
MPRAFITGITGQDGSYLAEFLLTKGYEVHGLIRATSRLDRIRHLGNQIQLHEGDLCDSISLEKVVAMIEPDEVYNLGAQTHVRVSVDEPEPTCEAAGMGVTRLLEAIRKLKLRPRFYQASTSEMFGNAAHSPQTEATPFHPRSPYGVAKVFGYWMTKHYREAHGLHASNGIMFNHESPRRGPEFVTRKIAIAVARIRAGLQQKLRLGDLDARRDWGYAGEYVEAMWQMLQQDEPDDYVIATGETHSVREFVEIAFERAGLDWREHVEVDPAFCRPRDAALLTGNTQKALDRFGWRPEMRFEKLVQMMVDAELLHLGVPAKKYSRAPVDTPRHESIISYT